MLTATHPFTAEQLREHPRLRTANRRLAERLVRTITPRALDDTIAALLLDDDDILPGGGGIVVADCCLHEWPGDGRTLVRRFAESTDARRLTGDERLLLDSWQRARLALLRVDEVWPGTGMRAHDALEGRDFAILDPVLSRPLIDGFWLIARILPVGDYWMTTPAVTIMGQLGEEVREKIRRLLVPMSAMGRTKIPLVLATLALSARAVLAGVEEEGRGEEEGNPYDSERGPDEELLATLLRNDPPPRMAPGRNDPCPCGSGKKHKKCCATARRGGQP
jgi:SEC-C motif